MAHLVLFSWLAWALVIATAALLRSKQYAMFLGIVLGIYTLCAAPLLAPIVQLSPLLLYFHAAAYVHWLLLAWPRLRPLPHRLLISLPGLYASGAILLAFPWSIARGLGFDPPLLWLPFLLCAFGLFQSLTTKRETHVIEVGASVPAPGLVRLPSTRGKANGQRPLRLVQISDTHLGPFMSVERLRRVCERAVEQDPDLILLTGDFLTMESQSNPAWLEQSLAPLAALPGRVFACLGNHDYEALSIVENALDRAGIRLLVDQSTLVETKAGLVQIVGHDFVWRERATHLPRVQTEHPRIPGALRLVLLHDPGAFRHLPEGDADLVLSGHTHGGQVGLVSFGLAWTVVSAIAKMPDHGLWARGKDRLYVHRGTGHYGFPLRLGVPAEESVLQVHFAGWPNS